MKRTYRFAQSIGSATSNLPDGTVLTVPVVPGILKHPTPDALPSILAHPDAVRKYTIEALRHASWPVLRLFPRDWLKECLDAAGLKPRRHQALLFLLG